MGTLCTLLDQPRLSLSLLLPTPPSPLLHRCQIYMVLFGVSCLLQLPPFFVVPRYFPTKSLALLTLPWCLLLGEPEWMQLFSQVTLSLHTIPPYLPRSPTGNSPHILPIHFVLELGVGFAGCWVPSFRLCELLGFIVPPHLASCRLLRFPGDETEL